MVYLLLFLCVLFPVSAEETIDPLELAAPLFPFNRPYQMAGLESPELAVTEAQERVAHNKRAIESRAFPWVPVIVACVSVGLVFLLRSREALGWGPYVPTKTPDQVRQEALSELNQLQTMKDGKRELTSLDKVVRDYLEGAHQIDASHRTSEELIAKLYRSHVSDPNEIEEIATFYREVDEGKYSTEVVTSQKAQQLVSVASKIITQLGKSSH